MKNRLSGLGPAVAGAGIIAVGAALWMLLSPADSRGATAASDFSAVPVAVRSEAPALVLNDLSGTRRALSDFRGNVVLVNLWATWCPPCAAEMPNLQRYYQKHGWQGFIVIGIEDGDSRAQVLSFVEAHGLTFPVWLDPTYEATERAFKTTSLPSSYVLDRAGMIRLRWIGAISEAHLEEYITPLIEE